MVVRRGAAVVVVGFMMLLGAETARAQAVASIGPSTVLAQYSTQQRSPFWSTRGGRKLIGFGVAAVLFGVVRIFRREE